MLNLFAFMCVSASLGVAQPPVPPPARNVSADRSAEAREPERALLTGVTVIDSNLRLLRTGVAVLDDDRVVLIDADDRRTVLDGAQVLAIIRDHDAPEGGAGVLRSAGEVRAAAQQPEIATTEGERFPGVLASAEESRGGTSKNQGPADETIHWTHLRFRAMSFSIDDVAWLHRTGDHAPGVGPGPAPREDELVLQNGDRRTGLMLGVGEPMVIESEGAPVEVEHGRIKSLALANPRGTLAGMAAWMEDGTVARVSQVRLTAPRGVWLRRADGQSAQYDAAALLAWCRDASRIIPLSSIEPISQAPTGDRPRAQPVRPVLLTRDTAPRFGVALDAWDIELPGPMSVEYEAPDGAQRLVGSARLAPGCDPWGDCELVIRSAGVEMLRERLRAGEDAVEFSVPLRGRSLTIETVAGEFGPVQDRVVLVRPLVLGAN